MQDDEIRAKLARRLNRREVPEWLWERLLEKQLVNAADDEGDYGWEDLEEEARYLLDVSAGRIGNSRREAESAVDTPQRRIRGLHGIRSAVCSQILARLAESKVQPFRDRALGGQKIPSNRIHGFLCSAAVRFFSFAWFKRHGIPVLGHQSEMRQSLEFQKPPRPTVFSAESIRVSPPGKSFSVSGRSSGYIHFATETGVRCSAAIWRNSVADSLQRLCDELCESFGFEPEDTIPFVLSGRAPRCPPIRLANLSRGVDVRSSKYGQCARYPNAALHLVVQPWVPAQVVYETYRDLQKRILRRNNRSLSHRILLLLLFVAPYEFTVPRRRTWIQLTEMWNRFCTEQKKREWKYARYRQLRRDYLQAKETLLFPDYDFSDFLLVDRDLNTPPIEYDDW